MNIKITITEDGVNYMGTVTIAGVSAVRDMSAEPLLCALADFVTKSYEEVRKQATMQLLSHDVIEPSESELNMAMSHVKLQDLKLRFNEEVNPSPSQN